MRLQKYALLSVFDKTGIVELAKEIIKLDFQIISTGGTAKVLADNSMPVIPIQKITGNPESFDGRIKTISFQVEAGILFDRTNKKHQKEAEKLNIKPIDLVVCNLYPFEKTVSNPTVKLDEAIENIDVGGPTMIRSAAKNFKNVLVVVNPRDYDSVLDYLRGRHSGEFFNKERLQNPFDKLRVKPDSRQVLRQAQDIARMTDFQFRQQLAAKAFAHLSLYDSQIARYFNKELFPQELTLPGRKTMDLRYGENPHQKAAIYMYPNTNSPLLNLKKEWGRDLSHINITDINSGLESVRLFNEPCAVIIKHNCPCGIALGKDSEEALERAIGADPESAFGGIIVLNRPMDIDTAYIIGSFKDKRHANIDIVAVPSVSHEALEYLKKVRKSMGIYTFGEIPQEKTHTENIKWIDGGFVYQTGDEDIEKGFKDWKIVTKKKPTKQQLEQMRIAWKFISRIKSNAIIVVDKKIPMTRGIGTGQTSRIRSVKIALEQAGQYAKKAILASDSFFPFDDSVKLATEKGIACIVQQGGSVNDQLSIDAADKAGIVMVFTSRRAFWH